MANLQIENVSIWTNKYHGAAKLHMKEESAPGDKTKYIFLSSQEAASLESKLTVALSGGFSEIEVRSSSAPVTLCSNGAEFCFVYGTGEDGKCPKAKVTFSRDGLIALRENIRILKKSLKALEKMQEQDVKKLDKFKNKTKNLKKQEQKPPLERQDELPLYHPLNIDPICEIEESQQGFLKF